MAIIIGIGFRTLFAVMELQLIPGTAVMTAMLADMLAYLI